MHQKTLSACKRFCSLGGGGLLNNVTISRMKKLLALPVSKKRRLRKHTCTFPSVGIMTALYRIVYALFRKLLALYPHSRSVGGIGRPSGLLRNKAVNIHATSTTENPSSLCGPCCCVLLQARPWKCKEMSAEEVRMSARFSLCRRGTKIPHFTRMHTRPRRLSQTYGSSGGGCGGLVRPLC